MTPDSFRFGRFTLDAHDRQLLCDGVPVEVNARYLDALALLVSEQGRLVSKDRFLNEVWRGVPVTDEALTQCIRTLRRLLGDDAAKPRFIETVVKHGYRFIAPVEIAGAEDTNLADPRTDKAYDWRTFFMLGGAGTLGAGLAGLIGGICYGFGIASQPVQAGVGSLSALLVVICLTVVIAIIGGAGVSFGIIVAGFTSRGPSVWSIAGGAAGGLVIGAIVKLLGLDAFNLLFGQSPGNITGAPEGAILGGGVGLAVWLAARFAVSSAQRVSIASVIGGLAGISIYIFNGRLMAGSLVLLSQHLPDSRLRLDFIWRMLGEKEFGPVSQIATGALEGALFGGCIVGAMLLAWQRISTAGAVRH